MVQVSTGPASPTFQAGAFQRSASSLLGSGRCLSPLHMHLALNFSPPTSVIPSWAGLGLGLLACQVYGVAMALSVDGAGWGKR